MSNLEKLIRNFREVWEKMPEVTSEMMDKMIDSCVKTDISFYDITDENIKKATLLWIENNKEKNEE